MVPQAGHVEADRVPQLRQPLGSNVPYSADERGLFLGRRQRPEVDFDDEEKDTAQNLE